MLRRIKEWTDVHALWLAAHDPRTPWYAKVFALAIAAYALSPIDLIPDFIPVLGYLDDVILLPLAILLAVRLVPPDLMAEHRAAAAKAGKARQPHGRRLHRDIVAIGGGSTGLVAVAARRVVTATEQMLRETTRRRRL